MQIGGDQYSHRWRSTRLINAAARRRSINKTVDGVFSSLQLLCQSLFGSVVFNEGKARYHLCGANTCVNILIHCLSYFVKNGIPRQYQP